MQTSPSCWGGFQSPLPALGSSQSPLHVALGWQRGSLLHQAKAQKGQATMAWPWKPQDIPPVKPSAPAISREHSDAVPAPQEESQTRPQGPQGHREELGAGRAAVSRKPCGWHALPATLRKQGSQPKPHYPDSAQGGAPGDGLSQRPSTWEPRAWKSLEKQQNSDFRAGHCLDAAPGQSAPAGTGGSPAVPPDRYSVLCRQLQLTAVVRLTV